MDYIVNYTVNNPNIHCVIQEKDAIIGRQSKEIEELHKANQLLAKDNDRLLADLDLQKKLCEALEKFKYNLERHVAALKDYDLNRWSIGEVESEVRIWEHEYLMVRKMLEKKEREEQQALLMASTVALNGSVANTIGTQSSVSANNNNNDTAHQTPSHRQHQQQRRTNKPRPVEVAADGTQLKRYVCDFPNCTYRSNWAHDLKGHKRKHTGEKPYTCGWLNCNKSFRDLRDLKRHQRAHTGDKRYSCDWPGCEYRSTDVANLAKHKRTHTGERPYKCDWAGCEASFADGSHLRRHQKKHENQMTKTAKISAKSPKKQSTTLSKNAKTGFVKIRQQPGRRAKGSSAGRILVEVTPDVPQEVSAVDNQVINNKSAVNMSNVSTKVSVIETIASNVHIMSTTQETNQTISQQMDQMNGGSNVMTTTDDNRSSLMIDDNNRLLTVIASPADDDHNDTIGQSQLPSMTKYSDIHSLDQ
ncbi:zinc finger protein 143-like [Oppia nitens]|uniref:zinc finger protein 143-like n=1 Tax=Oppia nitens TaxID=1686743 RepID=UPI0023DA140A|nr:zinc finger protein 143-like [Oppia nitens]